MKKQTKKLSAIISAMALAVSAVPFSTAYVPVSVMAEDVTYYARDPFYNFRSDYHYYESEHFQFIWGNGTDSSRVTQEFLEGNAKNFEAIWNVYMNDLKNTPPSQSVNLSLRDGKNYKTNIYISGTGLENMSDDWAYMSYDNSGFAYMFCCVDSMQYNPPSWVLPHEFGHVMTAHQLGWNDNKYSYAWWESLGNWYREQYLYSDYSTDETGHGTDFFETYLKNLSFTFPCGRDYYAAWPFLQYLTENPENLDGYGQDFVKKMLQEGQVDEYPFEQVDRLANADFKDTLGYFSAHMAGLDFKNGSSYRARLDELCTQGDWNWQQIYTMLQPVSGKTDTYAVPTERAPQFAGMNIIPLSPTENSVSVTLNGLSDVKGADWRACIVEQLADGSCSYSNLFKSGETAEKTLTGSGNVFLAVIAVPDLDTVQKYGLPEIGNDNSLFSEVNVPFSSKTQYPYTVTLKGCGIKSRTVSTESQNWWEQAEYVPHSNGGGLVASTASVDESVYVAPDAIVKGSAKVTGNVKLLDHAVVEGSATVSGNAVVSGYGMVAENAVVSGNAKIDDCGMVMGNANVSGNAKVIESACVYGNTKMYDNAVAKGIAFVMADAVISGQGIVDGDYYDDGSKTVTKGTSYGWVSSQNYADSRPYTDKLIYAYDFDSDSNYTFKDRYTSTYGVNYGAEWEENRTGANGVLTFDGNDFAELDKSFINTDNFEFQISFLDRNSNDSPETLAFVGNSDVNAGITLSGSTLNAGIKIGDTVHSLTAENVINKGEWNKLRIILENGKAQLILNDNVIDTGTTSFSLSDISNYMSYGSTACRIGADGNGENGFVGSVDFVRMYIGETVAPAENYTEKEEIVPAETTVTEPVTTTSAETTVTTTEETTVTTAEETTVTTEQQNNDVLYGDANTDGKITLADCVAILQYVANKEKYPLSEQGTVNADCYNTGDGITSRDALSVQKYDSGTVSSLPETE